MTSRLALHTDYPKFSQTVIESLAYYVYLLKDPESEGVFYIGKGCANRCFEHVEGTLVGGYNKEKDETISAIHKRGRKVEIIIHRHGLSEEDAFLIEASLIDFVGASLLSNEVRGHGYRFGQMTTQDVINHYDCPQAEISERAIIIKLNERFSSEQELYERTRSCWVLNQRRAAKADYVLSVSFGIIRQVYKVENWYHVTGRRWAFNGDVAENMRHLLNATVKGLSEKGAANPVRYLNC